MNYVKIYSDLVEKATKRDSYSKKWNIGCNKDLKYTEVHHIKPKCQGGLDVRSNLVVFSAKEHFIAHYLLTKIYPEDLKLNNAFVIMINKTEGKTSEGYKVCREKHSIRMKAKMSDPVYWTEERLDKLRKDGLRLAADPAYIKKVSEGVLLAYASTDLRSIISECSRLNWTKEEYKERISKSLQAFWTEENRNNQSSLIKQQNIDNPELKQKRIDAISYHMYNKSDEWISDTKLRMKKIANSDEGKQIRKDRYKGSNFDRSRKVINTQTKEIYESGPIAAQSLDLKYQVVKKWLYKNVPKHNLKWLDVYLQEIQNEQK